MFLYPPNNPANPGDIFSALLLGAGTYTRKIDTVMTVESWPLFLPFNNLKMLAYGKCSTDEAVVIQNLGWNNRLIICVFLKLGAFNWGSEIVCQACKTRK